MLAPNNCLVGRYSKISQIWLTSPTETLILWWNSGKRHSVGDHHKMSDPYLEPIVNRPPCPISERLKMDLKLEEVKNNTFNKFVLTFYEQTCKNRLIVEEATFRTHVRPPNVYKCISATT